MAQRDLVPEDTSLPTPRPPPPAPGFTCPLKYSTHASHKKPNRAAVSPGSPKCTSFQAAGFFGKRSGNNVGLGPRKSEIGTRKAGPSVLIELVTAGDNWRLSPGDPANQAERTSTGEAEWNGSNSRETPGQTAIQARCRLTTPAVA